MQSETRGLEHLALSALFAINHSQEPQGAQVVKGTILDFHDVVALEVPVRGAPSRLVMFRDRVRWTAHLS